MAEPKLDRQRAQVHVAGGRTDLLQIRGKDVMREPWRDRRKRLEDLVAGHWPRFPDPLPRDVVRTLILIVSPFAPHVAEELWQQGGHDVEGRGALAHAPWPTWDEALCEEEIYPRSPPQRKRAPPSSGTEATAAIIANQSRMIASALVAMGILLRCMP